MPKGDRTGPMGKGPMTGRGVGHCAGGGKGLGRKTLRSLCESKGISTENAIGTLREQGFTVSMDSLIKDLADEKGVSPSEIMDIINNIK